MLEIKQGFSNLLKIIRRNKHEITAGVIGGIAVFGLIVAALLAWTVASSDQQIVSQNFIAKLNGISLWLLIVCGVMLIADSFYISRLVRQA